METKSCQEGSLWQPGSSPLWKTLACVINNHQLCHPGESRGQFFLARSALLDSGLRRNDGTWMAGTSPAMTKDEE
jgi:hypothetical protein